MRILILLFMVALSLSVSAQSSRFSSSSVWSTPKASSSYYSTPSYNVSSYTSNYGNGYQSTQNYSSLNSGFTSVNTNRTYTSSDSYFGNTSVYRNGSLSTYSSTYNFGNTTTTYKTNYNTGNTTTTTRTRVGNTVYVNRY